MEEDINSLLKELLFHTLLSKIQSIENDEIKRFIYDFRDKASTEELESFANVFLKMDGEI
jgi:hypothetical protein